MPEKDRDVSSDEAWPVREGEGESMDMTLAEWHVYHQVRLIEQGECRWMGVTTYKNPLDLWIYQEIICEVRPDIIVEIGSYRGGSALMFAHLLDIIGDGLVVTVDIDRSEYEVEHDRIVTVTGDSSSAPIVGRVAGLCEDKKVIVIHDGDHSSSQVLKDMRAYAPMVSVGSYLIVEDGTCDQFVPGTARGLFGDFPEGGPLVAIREFLKEDTRFEVDRDRERYIITENPEGYLKRVR
jgi:cephalosporin hydroxylase